MGVLGRRREFRLGVLSLLVWLVRSLRPSLVAVGSVRVPRSVVPLWRRWWCRAVLWAAGRSPRVGSVVLGWLAPWLAASAVRWAWWGFCCSVRGGAWVAAPLVPSFYAPLRAWRGVAPPPC